MIASLYAISFIGMVITTVMVTKSDPTDPSIIFVHNIAASPQHTDANNHFVESRAKFWCNICLSYVIEFSKHCAKCNRCCADFDHHCIWVSNDIGRLNYVLFLRMMLFVLGTLSL